MNAQSWFGLVIVGCLGVALWADDTDPAPKARENDLMQHKLQNTQAIVDGLVRKDFRYVNDAATELLKTTEGHEWQSHEDETYQAYRDQLKRQSRKLINQAGVRNLEGATYAYMGILSTCVDCHSHCRDVLLIATEDPRLSPIPTAVDSDQAVTR